MANPTQQVALTKGALVSTLPDGTKQSIPFQYNPDTLRRNFETNVVGGQQGERATAIRFAGAPAETISLECHLSAIDAMDAGDPVATQHGVSPQLAALSLLLYPTSAQVTKDQAMLRAGAIEVVPPLANPLLLVWGGSRVLPVCITSFAVVEQMFDADLTPVHATVSMSLRVLTYSDVDSTNPASTAFLTYQISQEQLAQVAITTGARGSS